MYVPVSSTRSVPVSSWAVVVTGSPPSSRPLLFVSRYICTSGMPGSSCGRPVGSMRKKYSVLVNGTRSAALAGRPRLRKLTSSPLSKPICAPLPPKPPVPSDASPVVHAMSR